jgi:hypothetical protein
MLAILSILYAYPFWSDTPILGVSARVVLDACGRLELPMPEEGIKWGDISTHLLNIAGFGNTVGELKDGVAYPSARFIKEVADTE